MITERLSKVQVMTITVGAIFGVDILMVQHYMVKFARQDGWISLAIGGLLSIGFAFVYYLLAILHPDLDLPEIMLKLCGPFLGRLLLFPIALYAVLYAGLSARIFAQALKMFLLDRTPIYAIIGLMLVVVAYSVYKGIYVIGSISDVIFPICVFTIVSMLLMSFQQMDLDRLHPVLFENTDNVVRGIFPGFRHFLGFEIIAYVYCHTYRAKGTYKWFSAGLLIPIIFYVMLTVVSIGVFSVGSLKGLIFPTLTLSKSIEFPATFLERLESFTAVVWIALVFESLILFFYMSVRDFSVLLGISRRYDKYMTFALIAAAYIVSLLEPHGIQVLDYFLTLLSAYTLYTLIIIPPLTGYALLKRRRSKQ
ncbi:MAG TPA: endospore germination permease [Candidatus Atribacteria bacterium]|nr:endospore germination permease [Candidatus Atribacteria bacterium]